MDDASDHSMRSESMCALNPTKGKEMKNFLLKVDVQGHSRLSQADKVELEQILYFNVLTRGFSDEKRFPMND
ncbi:hypothetical protein Droror1_Dr00006539 [Drosera rotundifolia]